MFDALLLFSSLLSSFVVLLSVLSCETQPFPETNLAQSLLMDEPLAPDLVDMDSASSGSASTTG